MCPSAFRVSSPPGPGGEGVGIKPGPKPPWKCGDVWAKFHQERCRGLDFH